MLENDKRITTLYNMKNEYESLIYKIRDKISSEWQRFSTQEEKKNILQMLEDNEKWIEMENHKPLHSELDVKEYTERIDVLNSLVEMMKTRQMTYDRIEPEYKKFIELAKSKQTKVNFISI